jgi:hypothetical protein
LLLNYDFSTTVIVSLPYKKTQIEEGTYIFYIKKELYKETVKQKRLIHLVKKSLVMELDES